jgi:hypothetical protein
MQIKERTGMMSAAWTEKTEQGTRGHWSAVPHVEQARDETRKTVRAVADLEAKLWGGEIAI